MNPHRFFLALVLAVAGTGTAFSQRNTDKLDRGLVVIPTGAAGNSKTNNVTWRRLADEQYDVTYNLYKNGTRIATGLTTTCYGDNSNGLASTQYQVASVVRGVEKAKCPAVTAWAQYVCKLGNDRYPTAFLDIPLATVYDRNGVDVTDNYEPNDAEMADLDGDGQLEIIVKRLNTYDAWTGSELYPVNSTQFVVLDAYDVNWQTGAATLLWRIDCGPNMVSMNSTEINIVAYDWDEDGRAEVVLRGADNMIVYGSDGKTRLWTVGNMSVNTRGNMKSHSDAQYAWTHTGAEYLIYMNGATGAQYQVTDYPLKRLESGESKEKNAWGDDYGHRSTKHFIGAPFLDGRTASLFLARGIYTRHKMIAMDLNRSNHTWSERWRWNNNTSGSPWYGQGNHNYTIADVDEDGRDEIVYGSMVIDDNGHGLSTTGLGHGDALHVGDLDPYRPGLEVFACNEEKPAMNCRNATTSELYIRRTASGDDGRALMDNFSNTYPGSQGRSVTTGILSSVTDGEISELSGDGFIAWGDLNFRIYWDGDLCSEILNSPGTAREAMVVKPGVGRLFTSSGCNMNNDSKNNPCFQGDIIGDWREEIVVRCGRNLRVYTSGLWTTYSFPSLWFDHQYRQAMVWQMMAYNQPPHTSFFLGEMEGITQAPPVLTNSGRTEIADGGTISTTTAHLLMAGTGDMNVTVAASASPYMLTDNAPSWTQGHDNNSTITTTVATHTLTGGTLAGSMRLVKQGGGVLVLPKATHTYSGKTEVWGGTLRADGTLSRSAVWLNRFTALDSDGGTFSGGITMDYGAELHPGGRQKVGTLKTTTLTMNMGARLVLDVSEDMDPDVITANTLVINKVNWAYGPKYLAPVLQLVYQSGGALPDGTYLIGNVGTVTGSLDDIIVEGLGGTTYQLKHVSGKLQLIVGTGVSTDCQPATFTTQDYTMRDNVLLPTIGIHVPNFTYNGSSVHPNVSATFTDEDGTTTDASYYMFYDEDYESASDVTGWANSGVPMSIDTDNEHGRYLAINTGNSNTRYAYCLLDASVDVSAVAAYTVEFDLAMKSSNKEPVEFCVMSRGGVMPNNVWDNYAAINGNANMLFDITAPSYSTTYTVNATATTTNLSAETWYHYTLQVDRIARQVTWSISNGDNGTFALPDGTSADIAGFYFVAARYYSAFKLDNIKILTHDLSSYTFTRPGTLTVTTSYPGCRPARATFVATAIQRGDVNADGRLSIADVTALTAHLLGHTPATFISAAADVTGDGKVNTADVLKIVSMIIK